MKNFLNFVKNNLNLCLAAFFLVDFIICLFTSNPVDITAKRFKCYTLVLDLLWFFGLFETWATTNIEKLLNKRIDFVDTKVDLMYDIVRKAVEDSEKEKENGKEAADKEEKEVN